MKLNLRPRCENLKDSITLLNSPAIDFYTGKIEFEDQSPKNFQITLSIQAHTV